MDRKTLVLLGMIGAFIALKLYWLNTHFFINSDEYAHLWLAKYIVQHGWPFFQNVEWFPHFGLIYLPGFHYVLAFFLSFLPLQAVRYVFAIGIPALTTYFVWKLFYDYDSSGILAMAMNFIPAYFIYSSCLFQEGFLILLLVMTVYFFRKDDHYGLWILPYCLFLFTKHEITLLLAVPLAFHCWQKKDYVRLFELMALTGLMLLVQVFFMSANTNYFATVFNYMPPEPLQLEIHFYDYNPVNLFNTVFLTGAILLFAFLPFLWKEHKFEVVLFLTFMAPLLLGVTYERRFLFVAPLVFPLVYMAMKKAGLSVKAVAVFLAVLLVALSFYTLVVTHYFTVNPAWTESIDYINTLPENVTIMTPLHMESNYFTNRSVVYFNENLSANNATHVVIIKSWLSHTDYVSGTYYPSVWPPVADLPALGWKEVFNNTDVYILRRP